MSNIAGSLNSLIWLLIVIVVIAVVIWAVRMAFAPRRDAYREPPVVQQRVPSQPAQSGSLAPGWYPDQNDHRMMRYYDGRVWTSETRGA
jgi:uncharacterized protein DUF2510